MKYRNSILSIKEREEVLFHLVQEKKPHVEFVLTEDDFLKIKKLEIHLQLGYAIQLLYLRVKGLNVGSLYERIPENVVKYVASQLHCNTIFLEKYWKIKNTSNRHFQEIYQSLEFSKFQYTNELKNKIYKIAFSNGNNVNMIKEVFLLLKLSKIISPKISAIEHFLWLAIENSESNIYSKILEQVADKEKVRTLLTIEINGSSTYSRIKNITVNSNSTGVKELLKAIKELDTYGSTIDLSFLSEKKLRYYTSEIQRSDKFRIDKFQKQDKKDAYLAMFIYFRRKEFVDMVIEVTSSYASTVMKRSRKKTKEYSIQNHIKLKVNSEKLKEVVKSILKIQEIEELKKYQNSLLPLKNELEFQDEEMEDIDFLLKSHQSFNYLDKLLECIQFDSNTKPEFIRYLKAFESFKNKKKIHINISIFPVQWQKNIKKHGSTKKVVELAFLYSIRDYIRSGDIFVRESRKYNSFDHYLIEHQKEFDTEEARQFIEKLKLLIKIPKKIEFSTEIIQDEKSVLSDRIYSYFPKITMTEILYEVNSWTKILEDIRNLEKNSLEKQKSLIATLLANGHNIGFSKMSISSSIDEAALRRINEFYFNNEALSKAQKTLVNYHHSLKIVNNWGSGDKSSSDGMRVPINSKTIYADYNAHYGNKGGGIYRHISDQYTPFYVQMLEGRDSNHVLDGLLYHGTDLDIYEHSTDTAGYTEQMFALTYFLGFNFKPRIKNLNQQQLYAFENKEVEDIKFKKINEKIIIENHNEIMRLIESIRCGKVKASLILQKINSYNRDNGVAKGLKEIGRILKTKYILEYYSDEQLRKEVQKMLNKGESINSVGRLMFFGKHGRLNENTIEKQLEKASCLNILLSSLIIWNSRYLDKVYWTVKDEEWFDEKEFHRVSPLGTQHVNFLGKYIFEEKIITAKDGLRELAIKDLG